MKLGVTGHQRLRPPAAWDWVRAELRKLLAMHAQREGAAITSLAAGADQEFADEALAAGIPVHVVLPCRRYELAFENEANVLRFQALLEKASHVTMLQHPAHSEQAFLEAGQCIVEASELLIAIWDGEPSRGPGGTGDIVSYAKCRGKAIVHVDPYRQRVTELRAARELDPPQPRKPRRRS
jgi:hypothetical protein